MKIRTMIAEKNTSNTPVFSWNPTTAYVAQKVSAVNISTAGYCQEIGSLQKRHLPPKSK